ncbi:helix-turn-helix domain-containing protein [Pedobacter sp. SL55]|uniref:helix-turn-helix domain-containing protein n=1 Tax=Pedobacter sp. SL55 TaxID=2995161 RepID=UPI002271E55C|nr:AraC family transcriptional regulator [Pedobacter sp. SL55]WAC41615.1 AraC family transcriptional regulator [Pedobacter sp. SL55]
MEIKGIEITSCYIGPEISPEHFIPEHLFMFLAKGDVSGYDGHQKYTMKSGEYCLVRKNHLARYTKQEDNGAFDKVVVVFDEDFLQQFQQKHQIKRTGKAAKGAFYELTKTALVPNFVSSLMPYYNGSHQIDGAFEQVKKEELLLILLQTNADLVNVLFDFGIPEKIDLEIFMNHNYKFNVGMERFAYLTGRSLSSFKRDFVKIFSETPNRWLIKKRLKEAHFLIQKKKQKPTEIYLDLGFEDLSHFSFAFKKLFGYAPTKLAE